MKAVKVKLKDVVDLELDIGCPLPPNSCLAYLCGGYVSWTDKVLLAVFRIKATMN